MSAETGFVSKIPETQSAITQDEHGQPRLVNGVAIPALLPGTVLIKTAAVALNPSDHKMGASFPTPGSVIGMDFAGTVVRVADEGTQTGIAPGSVVCGAVQGSNPAAPDNGAFAEYLRAPADLLMRVPSSPSLQARPDGRDSNAMIQAAATMGTALATCILALWGSDTLDLLPSTPDTPSQATPPTPVLVYGGSTATGSMAIQLLRLSGFSPIATCSPHNFELVRARGASAVFDYAAEGVASAIREHTGCRLRYALDCIADAESVACCYTAIQRAGGRYTSLELVGDELLSRRRAVRPSFIMAPEVFGEELKLPGGYGKPASLEKRQLAVRFFAIFQRLLDEGKLKFHPIELLEGGFESVVDGLSLLKSGALSGKKLVAVV
ncbi:hypothetical protein INS49_005047 [Diaporthe citri]|uniref:uncharacterized protein n=1 Tax=Diaporthe citri TaxID=83186 RepID=UPI001C7E932D|nr:uncharacterized protein INS49_005047 [Diaporthe citri]KAG6354076.1 hypothetical protein INS49_005047 [Diaporthe citri]